MADKLETVNSTNAKSKIVEIRLLWPRDCSPTSAMTVFSARLVSSTGHYTVGEEVIFGDEKKRASTLTTLKRKWVHESTWTLQSLKVKKKQDKYHGCPHGWLIDLGAPSMKATRLTGPAADAISKDLEPQMTISDFTGMSTSQVVDFHAFVMAVGPTATRKDKDVVEVTLADAKKVTLPLTFWQDMIAEMPTGMHHKVIYGFGAYLVKETTGGLHLSPRKSTRWVISEGTLPLAKALLNSGIAAVKVTDDGVTQLSRRGDRDFKSCPAIEACIADMELSTSLKNDISDQLFELPSTLIILEDADNVLTKDGLRIYAMCSISDYSGTTTAMLLQEPALSITKAISKTQFVELANIGALTFSRSRIRVRRAPGKAGGPKLTIVCGVPRLVEVPPTLSVAANDERLIPARLSTVKRSPSGKLAVTIDGKELLATGILAMVTATQEADTVQRDDTFAIKNFVKDAMNLHVPGNESDDKIYHAFTTAPISRLNRYAMEPQQTALIHVTNITHEGLIVADMWQLPKNSTDISTFAAEIAHAMVALGAPENMKRKAESMEDIFLVAKRVCATFDAAPVA